MTPRPVAAVRPPSPRRGRGDVLAAAAALFHERGADATSMHDVAARLGVTKAALYRHVRDRAELLRAVTAPVRAEVRDALAASAAADDRPAADRITSLLDTLARAGVADPVRHALFWGSDGAPSRDPADAACREAVVQRLAQLLEQAATRGEVRDDMAPRIAARLLLGAVTGAVAGRDTARSGAPDPASSMPVVTALLEGPVRSLAGGRRTR